ATATVPPKMFASWFEKGTPTLNGAVKPAESVSFSDDPALKNVDFYRWAEQMFLWITSPVPGAQRKIVLNSPCFFTVSLPDEGGRRRLIPNAANRPPDLATRVTKTGPRGLPVVVNKAGDLLELEPGKLVGAAQGTTMGVQMTQNGSLVYYMVSVNDVYA